MALPALRWLSIVLLAVGCAREGAGSGPTAPLAPNETPRAWNDRALQSLRIPGGAHCLSLLGQLGVPHEPLSPIRGMSTPVEVRGAIGGIRYTTGGEERLVCDCRLALALHWSAPVLSAWRVSEVEHYGAYSYRTTRKGRPSLHARGLALDAAAFKLGPHEHRVERDYARGWGTGCSPEAPALNQITCQLRDLGIFRELITPDHDRDHHDHIHLAILPL
jgi:hypothetical protein